MRELCLRRSCGASAPSARFPAMDLLSRYRKKRPAHLGRLLDLPIDLQPQGRTPLQDTQHLRTALLRNLDEATGPLRSPLAAQPLAPLQLRKASEADVPRLVEMNRAAYPDLAKDNVVYDANELRAHLAAFPEGQLVATRGGRIVGALSTLIVHGRRALAPHSWVEITGDGRFTTHDATGDTLYLADVYVAPEAWGTKVGPFLYRALQALCVRLGLARVVAGGRMCGYGSFDGPPAVYAEAVQRGELGDRVLTSQLRAGFQLRGFLPGYLHDAPSRGHATLLEWVAPRRRVAREAEARAAL
jgi:predicted N-acetyltransferase YhbS